jgi:hypothetical protein
MSHQFSELRPSTCFKKTGCGAGTPAKADEFHFRIAPIQRVTAQAEA